MPVARHIQIDPENIPQKELEEVLAQFYLEARQQNGAWYKISEDWIWITKAKFFNGLQILLLISLRELDHSDTISKIFIFRIFLNNISLPQFIVNISRIVFHQI